MLAHFYIMDKSDGKIKKYLYQLKKWTALPAGMTRGARRTRACVLPAAALVLKTLKEPQCVFGFWTRTKKKLINELKKKKQSFKTKDAKNKSCYFLPLV